MLARAGYAGRHGQRAALRTVAATRVLSALTAVPAFFAGGAPGVARAAATAAFVLTVAVVVLLMPQLRKTAASTQAEAS